jgi:hypothetical protein
MPEWKKVSEELPEIGVNVLVYAKYAPYMGVCRLVQYSDNAPIWDTDTASGYECDLVWTTSVDGPFADITHWMPLPERPE